MDGDSKDFGTKIECAINQDWLDDEFDSFVGMVPYGMEVAYPDEISISAAKSFAKIIAEKFAHECIVDVFKQITNR